ncbi:MAG TPA: TadE/TadG family type IV pilus assembly protein [Candidatus Polarisedimenticolia bacterium]|nr:TadE/TadG family type IV pilus assembly protein [Candidatus Polarisedimenticolia bacterium]
MRLTPKTSRADKPKERRRKSRGQGLVEFALILPIFLVLLSAAIDLGRIAYARIAVDNAAREGAFQASVTPTSYTAGQPCPPPDPLEGEVLSNLVICRALLEAQGSVVTVTPSDVVLTCSPSCTEGMGNLVTVKVNGTFKLLTPFMAVFFGGYDVAFAQSATMQIETLPAMPSAGPPSPSPSASPSPSVSPSPSPSPSTSPACSAPSAGFTYTVSPSTLKSPVTMTVTDTSTATGSCPINSWTWNWGDGTVTYNVHPTTSHVFYNPGPASNKTFSITLTVSNNCSDPNCSATSGAVAITVKK